MSQIDDYIGKDIAFKSDFVLNPNGDLDTIEGLANLKEALFRRLITTPGSLIHRPEYGVGVKRWQNSINNLDNRRTLALAIKEQFQLEERVEVVTGVSFNFVDNRPDRIEILCRVLVRGYGETTFGFVAFGDV